MDKLFLINDIYSYIGTSCMERILWIDPNYEYCFSIDVFSKKLNIKHNIISVLEENLENGLITIVTEDPTYKTNTDLGLSAYAKTLLQKAEKIINFIDNKKNEPDLFYDATFRRKIILEAAENFQISDVTIYKYLRKYWQGGKIIESMICDKNKCGGKGKERSSSNSKKLGRPNKIVRIAKLNSRKDIIDKYSGVNLTEEDKEKFRKAYQRYYLNSKGTSLSMAYELMIKDFYFTIEEENGELIKKNKPVFEIPTESSFRSYYYNKYRDIETETRKRLGDKAFERNHRALKSNSFYWSFGPGAVAQIDATETGVYLVNRIVRNQGVGKPTIYFVPDVFSTMICGVCVMVGPPSWDGASSAIYNCVEDKVEFCKQFGLSIDKNKWPNSTLPSKIMADNGELAALLPEPIISHLGIRLENAASWRGDQKGLVENDFCVYERRIKPFLESMVHKSYRERGERDPKLDAQLDIEEYTRIVLRTVIHHNNKEMPNYPLSRAMIEDSVYPTPVNIWNWGVKHMSGNLRKLPEEYIKLNLMRRGVATVTERGIRFGETYYDCEKANLENWYVNARRKGYKTLNVCFDHRNMNKIYIINENASKFEICEMMKEYEAFRDRTFEEIHQYKEQHEIEMILNKDNKIKNDFELNEGIESDIKQSKKRRDNFKINKKDLVHNIKEQRAQESQSYGKKQALNIDIETNLGPETNKNDNNIENNNGSMQDTIRKSIFNQIVSTLGDD